MVVPSASDTGTEGTGDSDGEAEVPDVSLVATPSRFALCDPRENAEEGQYDKAEPALFRCVTDLGGCGALLFAKELDAHDCEDGRIRSLPFARLMQAIDARSDGKYG